MIPKCSNLMYGYPRIFVTWFGVERSKVNVKISVQQYGVGSNFEVSECLVVQTLYSCHVHSNVQVRFK